MAELIDYYIPANFSSLQTKWVFPAERGKVLEFHGAARNDPEQQQAAPHGQVLASTPCLSVSVVDSSL
jgi:hypothetical protein